MMKFWAVIGIILTLILGGIITTFAIGEKNHRDDIAKFSQKQWCGKYFNYGEFLEAEKIREEGGWLKEYGKWLKEHCEENED